MDNHELKIDDNINKYFDMFVRNPNIVGVGRGYKVINGKTTNIPTLTFRVEKKLSTNLINPYNRIPKVIDGTLTDIYESKRKVLLRGEVRPAIGGVSIGESEKKTFGTLGCAVTDNEKKKLLLLGCAHVIAPNNIYKFPRDQILQPSPIKGGTVNDSYIATLHEFVELKYLQTLDGRKADKSEIFNIVDAAVAYVGRNNLAGREMLNLGIREIGDIKGVVTAKNGDEVHKVGYGTGLSFGKVINENSIEIIKDYKNRRMLIYKNQITVRIINGKGDSGAIGMLDDTDKGFGMLISGNGQEASFCDLQKSLELLHVVLADDELDDSDPWGR